MLTGRFPCAIVPSTSWVLTHLTIIQLNEVAHLVPPEEEMEAEKFLNILPVVTQRDSSSSALRSVKGWIVSPKFRC